MSTPRIAVIGGGWSGTLCALVLQHRGLLPTVLDQGRHCGGRLRAGSHTVLRATNPRLAALYQQSFCGPLLQRSPAVSPRWGVLGSSGGGFLSAAHIPRRRPSDDDANAPAWDGDDFCHFIEGAASPTFVGDLPGLCAHLLEQSHISTRPQTVVHHATAGPEGWQVQMSDPTNQNDTAEHFDGLVVASHDASLAARIIGGIADAEQQQAGDAVVVQRLSHLRTQLQRVRDEGRAPVFTLQFTLDDDNSIPFDAVTVPGSPVVQFLARPANAHRWTAVSTSQWAADLLDSSSTEQATHVMTEEIQKLVAPFTTTPLTNVSLQPWRAAFTRTSLEANHDSLALQPWRLAVCGDYIRPTTHYDTPLEAAAVSGLEAGEQMASFFDTEAP